jgi:hypothetical protein
MIPAKTHRILPDTETPKLAGFERPTNHSTPGQPHPEVKGAAIELPSFRLMNARRPAKMGLHVAPGCLDRYDGH